MIKRYIYAKFFLNMLASGKRIVNIDESAYSSLNYPKKVYMIKGKPR